MGSSWSRAVFSHKSSHSRTPELSEPRGGVQTAYCRPALTVPQSTHAHRKHLWKKDGRPFTREYPSTHATSDTEVKPYECNSSGNASSWLYLIKCDKAITRRRPKKVLSVEKVTLDIKMYVKDLTPQVELGNLSDSKPLCIPRRTKESQGNVLVNSVS